MKGYPQARFGFAFRIDPEVVAGGQGGSLRHDNGYSGFGSSLPASPGQMAGGKGTEAMKTPRNPTSMAVLGLVAIALAGAAGGPARAEDAAVISIEYSNQHFEPAEASAPADRPLVLHVRNASTKTIEFESKTLHVEKVIAAGTEGIINLRPQKPGRYEYFNDFDHEVRGALVVK
ncbi:MAG: cupredoxin domain-containing protein [Xanthobacteraceae bacterium]